MNRISRRNFLKAAGVGAAALGLAACGGSSSSTASSVASSTAASSAAAAADVTIKVAAIETGYGADMWKKVAEAFTAQTGIKVDLTTDKKLEDVIGPSMQGGDYPDVVHLATGREAALTEQFIKGNLIADITDVLSMTVPGESKKVSEDVYKRQAQRSELDYLIYNDPLGYANLILDSEPEEYLKNAAGSHGLEI